MTAPFVNQLRTRGDVIRMAPAGAPAITVRVESPDESLLALKTRALEALYPVGVSPDELVLKLRGFEVIDESASLASLGAVDGSICLVTYRRRRPVR